MKKLRIVVHKRAEKFFKKHNEIKEKFKNNIIEKIKFNKEVDIRKLVGYEDLYRMRIGQFRVIYRVTEDNLLIIIEVENAGARGDIYKKR